MENAPKAKFEAYKGKKRKPGTGYVKQLSPNCWQGRYTPTINGKRTSYNIYAPTEIECEEKLAELIKKHQGRARAKYRLRLKQKTHGRTQAVSQTFLNY